MIPRLESAALREKENIVSFEFLSPEAYCPQGRPRQGVNSTLLVTPEIGTHSIQHSTAMHLLENGASIRHVQELLGHKSLEFIIKIKYQSTIPPQADGVCCSHKVFDSGSIPLVPPQGAGAWPLRNE